jgi:hypothetical protein
MAVLQEWSQIGDPIKPAETRNWGLVVLVIVLLSLTLATVVARLWARILLQRNFGWDDGVIIVGMVCLLFRCIQAHGLLSRSQQQDWLFLYVWRRDCMASIDTPMI